MYAHVRRAWPRRLLTGSVITILVLALAVPAASAAPKTKLMSQSTGGDQSSTSSGHPDISGTGNTVVFHVQGDDLLGDDYNHVMDVYRRIVATKKTKLASRGYDGNLGNDSSRSPNISANGRYVVFKSEANHLTPNYINTGNQVYRRDLLTGKTKLVSKGPSGHADQTCGGPRVSANGRYVVFPTAASNLTSKPTYGVEQVYLRDMQKKKTYLISQAGGTGGNGDSGDPVVSANGRFVAFESEATNLWSKDERGVRQVFLRDRLKGKTYLISQNPTKHKAGDGWSQDVVMSDDGRYLAFESQASNLIKWGADSNGYRDIYKYDRSTRKMTRVSVNYKGRQLTGCTCGGSEDPDISADGKVIVFASDATNVVKGGTGSTDVHIYRRGPQASSIKLISRNNKGDKANGYSRLPKVSANGKYVVFESGATNLTNGYDDNGSTNDVFRRGPF